ncbi:MAG: CHRD domain-containing protein, partial [Verrucomicrobiota bacterium]
PGRAAALYRFVGAPGQRLYFDGQGSDSEGDWVLYGPNNETLGSANVIYDFEVTLGAAGVYVLAVRGNSPDPLPVSLQVVTPQAPSNPLTLGATVTGNVLEAGEDLVYTFSGAPGQRLYYDALDGDFDQINVRLYAPSGANVHINNNSDSDVGPFTLTESGTYRLVIDGSGSTTGDFSFRLLDVGVQPSLSFDTVVSASLNPGRAAALYRFVGAPGQRLYFDGQGTDSAGDWELFGPNNEGLGSANLIYDFQTTLGAPGTYVLAVRGNSANPVPYSFRVSTPNDLDQVLTNDPPFLSPLADRFIPNHTATQVLFTVGDTETPAGSLVVVATSSNPDVVQNSGLVVTGVDANRTLTITPQAGQVGLTIIVLTATDADGRSISRGFVASVEEINDSPIITLPGPTVNYTENNPPAILDATATVSDPDSPNFDTGRLTVSFLTGGTAEDRLGIRNQGVGPGQIGLSGTMLSFNFSYGGLSGNSTAMHIHGPAGPGVSAGVLHDLGSFTTLGGPSGAVAGTVTLTGPQVSDLHAGLLYINVHSTTFPNGEIRGQITPVGNGKDFTITLDAAQAGATGGTGSGSGTLALMADTVLFAGSPIGTSSGGGGLVPLEVMFNANATPAAVEALVRNVTFANVSEAPATAIRIVGMVLTDGDGGTSSEASIGVSVTAQNDPPVVVATAGPLNYLEGSGAAPIDPGLTVSDVDSADLVGATVRIVSGFVSGQDELLFNDANGITGSYDPTTGVLTLSGTASVAFYEVGLKGVSYQNTSANPNTAPRLVIFAANDGTMEGTASRTVNVASVNDPPVNTVPGSQTTLEDAALVFASAHSNAIGVSDVDAGSNAVQVELSASNGTLTLSATTGLTFTVGDGTLDTTMTFTGTLTEINAALNGLAFDPAPNYNGSASVSITSNDQGSSGPGGAQNDTDSVSITVTSVNDAPAGTDTAVTTNEDTAYTFASADFGFSDPNDSPANAFLAVKITTLPSAGTLAVDGTAVSAGDFVSLDPGPGGAVWTARESDRGWTSVASSADGTKLVAGVYNGGQIYTSTDSGVTWTARASSGNWYSVASSADGTKLVAVDGSPGQIYTSSGAAGLVFTPAANANGSPYTTFTFQVQDDGGTSDGGVDLDPTANMMTINVTAVNEPPAAIADADAGANTVAENAASGTT